MFICNCKGIDEELLDRLKSEGYTLDEVREITGLGSGCGGCLDDARDIYDDN